MRVRTFTSCYAATWSHQLRSSGLHTARRSPVLSLCRPSAQAASQVTAHTLCRASRPAEADEAGRDACHSAAYQRYIDRKSQLRLRCACCQTQIYESKYRTHLQKCCPDLMSVPWPGPAAAAAAAAVAEARNEERVVRLCFHETPQPSHAQVAVAMGMSETRVKRLIRKASLAIPMVVDAVPVEVLYEDQHMLAVNKPPGLRMAPRHRFEGGSLLNRMLHHLGTATGGAKPYIVHRLDMDTSGVVVFAKTASAADALCRQFRERSSRKEYVALCVAAPTAAASASASAFTAPVTTTFHVDAPIGRSPLGKEYRAVVPDGDASYTEFRTLAVGAWHGTPVYAMHAAPRTGRTHQIRVHLAHVGLPILGDMQYLPAALRAADTPTSPPLPHPPRHALHAKQLTLTHPVDDARLMTFVAPLPADMRHTAEALGLVGVAPAGLRTSIDGWL